MHGLWQLTRLTLTTDIRRLGSHAVRFGLAIVLYAAVVYASLYSTRNAAGLPLFQSQLLITAFFLSATAIFGFSQTITEEKEEETLGLIRLADISPLAIILGKTMGILVEAALLLIIQVPFTIVAITLGGVAWSQVTAAYVALGAYLWLLGAVGIAASVLEPTGGRAARWTAIIVGAYLLPPMISWMNVFGLTGLLRGFAAISLPMRLLEITESDFRDGPWSSAVWFGIITGLIVLIVAWLLFDRASTSELHDRQPKILGFKNRRARRPWSRPIVWREYEFLTGGVPWTIARVGIQVAIFVLVSYSFFWVRLIPRSLGFTLAWSAIASGVVGLLDGTWFASRLFQDEIRHRTWSSLVQTPYSLPRLALDKTLGWALGLAPTILSPFLFIIAMIIFHEHMPRDAGNILEVIIGTATIGMSVFGYLHLLVLTSLYFGWKGTPMTLTICFAAGWIYVVAVFTSRLDGFSRCALFVGTSLAIVGLMIVFQLMILKRLERLAAG
jgi:ABC-type transport system involved in cytochrome c biogenesis permease component